MSVNQQKDDIMRRYLLGISSEAESEAVERVYLTDTHEYESLGVAEDDLIEDYLAGRLDSQEKHEFEHHFLNADLRREQLAFARALRAVILRASRQAPKAVFWKRFLGWFKTPTFGAMGWEAGAIVAMVVVGFGLLFSQNRQLARRYSLVRAEKQELANQNGEFRRRLQASSQPSSSPATAATHELEMISSVLSPGLTRSIEAPIRISIPATVHLATLKLELFSGDYHQYRAVVRFSEGEELLSQSNLRPSSRREVAVLVPTDLLQPGDYQILLAGQTADGQYESVATYSFRIVR